MNGGRCSTTRIWRRPSSTASWSADGLFASTDPRDELVISSWRTPCQAVPNGSEYLEYVAQNFRNPQQTQGIRGESGRNSQNWPDCADAPVNFHVNRREYQRTIYSPR